MDIDKRYVTVLNMFDDGDIPRRFTMTVNQFRRIIKLRRSDLRPHFVRIGKYGVKEYELSKEAQ